MPQRICAFEDEYDFLSSFYELKDPIVDEYGIEYYTVEHAYQAAKTMDRAERIRISKLPKPNGAKIAGNGVDLRPDWEEVKYNIMFNFVYQKFQSKSLRKHLLSTGDAVLIEGTVWHDKVWGVCTCKQHKGGGENWLGRILMVVREMCYQEERIKALVKKLDIGKATANIYPKFKIPMIGSDSETYVRSLYVNERP